MKKNLAIAAGVLALAALILWIALPPSAADEAHDHAEEVSETENEELLSVTDAQIKSASIGLHEVSLGSLSQIIVPGTVEANPTGLARLDARADGTVRSVRKSLGDNVARGETVVLIESAQAALYSSDISAAKARLSQAQAAYTREKRLFEARVTARQDLEAAEAQLAIARADLNRARSTASAAGVNGQGNTVAVTSPINGRVTDTSAVLGSFVTAGTELMRIVDPARIQIEAAVPARDARQIVSGADATIIVAGQEISGRVRSITPALDPETRTATAIILPLQSSSALTPDGFVEVRISTTGDADANVISIPEEAVQTVDGKTIVFVREEGGFKPVEVQTGTRSAGTIPIISGLSGGETIASTNAFLLKADLEKSEAEHGH